MIITKNTRANLAIDDVGYFNLGKTFYIILLNLIFLILIISVTEFAVATADSAFTRYIMTFGNLLAGIFAVYSITSIWLIYKIIEQKAKEVEVQKNKELTEIYKSEISRMYNDVRDFKHDYMKIYSSMSTLIADGDTDKLKIFFEKEVVPLQQELLLSDTATHTITNIEDSIVHGLIYSYVVRARNNNINFTIDISEHVPKNEAVASRDLCRILGILLDNAFESAAESENRTVIFGIVNTSPQATYVIKNSYEQVPDISKLMQTHYTTKGGEHGRGLSIAHKIISRYKTANINMELKNKFFVCELII